MDNSYKKSHKIINDPVYGFISIDEALLLQIIDHPWVQRLRRIKQLGKTSLVYPGAQHTRFQHSLGAMHLMQMAIDTLRKKGVDINADEALAAKIAMLLHDVGHGPFSHVLEHSLIDDINHELITLELMRRINTQLDGQLQTAIETYSGTCRPFLHQLISSQLDTDRLDYLKRDSFFTGVTEGTIGSDRIIKMLNVADEQLVVEAKGIYSIEKFLIARRLMYWQVYLHKTVVAAEKMLNQIIRRAKSLALSGQRVFASPQLAYFLQNTVSGGALSADEVIENFCMLDDSDITSAIKVWTTSTDRTLSLLSSLFVNRELFRIETSRVPFAEERICQLQKSVAQHFNIDIADADYFVVHGQISSKTYTLGNDRINIMFAPDDIRDISEASDMLNLAAIGKSDTRHYLCYPKTEH